MLVLVKVGFQMSFLHDFIPCEIVYWTKYTNCKSQKKKLMKGILTEVVWASLKEYEGYELTFEGFWEYDNSAGGQSYVFLLHQYT